MKILCICASVIVAATTIGEAHAQAPAAGTAVVESNAAPPTAAAAAEQVKRALRAADLASKDIIVSTHAETIILTGHVPSTVDAARALSTAETAAGGIRISSQIEVKPGQPPAVEQRSADQVRDVEEALKQDSRTANLGIMVSVDERQMIGLHGLVPTRESSVAAESVAKQAVGAQRIRNYLVVPQR